MQAHLKRQRDLDVEEQNVLKREIEILQVQLKDISSDIIGRESELTLHKGKLEAEKRKFITEKDILISQLELERQSIGVSILQVNTWILSTEYVFIIHVVKVFEMIGHMGWQFKWKSIPSVAMSLWTISFNRFLLLLQVFAQRFCLYSYTCNLIKKNKQRSRERQKFKNAIARKCHLNELKEIVFLLHLSLSFFLQDCV